MRVSFWYQYGQIDGIGTGHKYRSHALGKALEEKGHTVKYIEDDIIVNDSDVMVIDHMNPPKSVADRARAAGMKVVIFDAKDSLADVTVSAFVNDGADYKGSDHLVFPVSTNITNYDVDKKSNTVFVGMGGYDRNNYAEIVLDALDKMKVNAIVAKSINHTDFRGRFSRVEIFEEDDYYTAMHECVMAITNGGLTLFQALHYGMPTIALAQYEHQETNIRAVGHCCLNTQPDAFSIELAVRSILDSEYHRRDMSTRAKHYVDGLGVDRVCSIIEALENK